MVFSICTQVFNVNVGETRNKKFKFLFVEDRNESLGDDVIKTFQECVESKKKEEKC